MVFFSIQYERRVKKDLKKLDKSAVKRIVAAVDKLDSNPYPSVSKPLVASDLWSLRVGSYRVIYSVNNNLVLILVLRIGHRKNIYRQ